MIDEEVIPIDTDGNSPFADDYDLDEDIGDDPSLEQPALDVRGVFTHSGNFDDGNSTTWMQALSSGNKTGREQVGGMWC